MLDVHEIMKITTCQADTPPPAKKACEGDVEDFTIKARHKREGTVCRCTKRARYVVGDKKLCGIHAGQALLRYMLER